MPCSNPSLCTQRTGRYVRWIGYLAHTFVRLMSIWNQLWELTLQWFATHTWFLRIHWSHKSILRRMDWVSISGFSETVGALLLTWINFITLIWPWSGTLPVPFIEGVHSQTHYVNLAMSGTLPVPSIKGVPLPQNGDGSLSGGHLLPGSVLQRATCWVKLKGLNGLLTRHFIFSSAHIFIKYTNILLIY